MTPPRRRWPRFSLRTLFVVVTVFGILAPIAARVYRAWSEELPDDESLLIATERQNVIVNEIHPANPGW